MIKRIPHGIVSSLIVSAYLLGSTASASTTLVSDNLLTSSNLTTEWLECGADSVALDVANLDAGGCAYRTTPAEPGILYSLSCGVVVAKYASITLAFLDANDNQLGDAEVTEIFEHVSGAYSVTLQSPAGTVTAAIGIYGETGSGFQDCALIDATPTPEPTKGSIAGTTWFDDVNDSVFDSAENIITGTPVTLFFNGEVLEQTTTGADGAYYFGSLDVGVCYTLGFDVVDSTVELGSAGNDNDAGTGGLTDEICLTETAADVTDIDAGYVAVAPVVPPADYAICSQTWIDADDNGEYNSGDSALGSVRARLFDADGKRIKVITSDSRTGRVIFANLPEGDYQVRFVTPSGYEPIEAVDTPTSGKSYVDSNGNTPIFNIPDDNNATAGTTSGSSPCTITNVSAGYRKLPVALEPTIANDDEATQEVGVDFSIAVLGNDEACEGVNEVNLLGHNVPGNVTYNTETQQFDVSSTIIAGTYSIEYGLRGVCGSYDTAVVTVELTEPPIVLLPNAPDAPMCRIETGGDVEWGGVDVFSLTENGFTAQYNMYGRDKDLIITLNSNDTTHKKVIGNNVNHWSEPWIGNWEIEWNGANYGYNQVSVYYVAAVENGLVSHLTECVRSSISPIALDLENKGRIQRIAGSFEIDLNNDGINEALSQWFAPSAGILVNKNASGKVSGQDLFGNIPGVYADGFEELQTLDVNDDGQLTNDELNSLAIWNDLNSDTMVDQSELSTLADHDLVSLAVHHYKFMARAKKSTGKSILMEDVWLPHASMAALAK